VKGVILAGGTGSRLFPLTKVTNKHLLPVGTKPMILHSVEKLAAADIREVMIVTGVEHMGDVVNLLGSGKDYGCEFTYRVQDEAGGIAQALGLTEAFCRGTKLAVLLGDNIFSDPLGPYATAFHEQAKGAKILLKEVADPNRFGVAEIQGARVMGIEEKPKHARSSFAVTGIYFYDPQVFSFIKTLKPSGRGELEITDVNNHYIAEGIMTYEILKGAWTDAGTFESLRHANNLMLEAADGI
jgi:glucose-1-phosphate thymidylyltransferase